MSKKKRSKATTSAGSKKSRTASKTTTSKKSGGIIRAIQAAASKIREAITGKRGKGAAAAKLAGGPGVRAEKPSSRKGAGKPDVHQAPRPGAASVAAAAYVPKQQSMHSAPGGSGKGRDRDEEVIAGEVARNEQFNDEDRLTNKSGDPRIGTHRGKRA